MLTLTLPPFIPPLSLNPPHTSLRSQSLLLFKPQFLYKVYHPHSCCHFPHCDLTIQEVQTETMFLFSATSIICYLWSDLLTIVLLRFLYLLCLLWMFFIQCSFRAASAIYSTHSLFSFQNKNKLLISIWLSSSSTLLFSCWGFHTSRAWANQSDDSEYKT